MYKKYFKFIKCSGLTELYLLKKDQNITNNQKFSIPIKNLTSLNPIAIDHVSHSYILHGVELIHIANIKHVIKVTDTTNTFGYFLPIPIEKIIKINSKLFEKSSEENQIELLVYQFYELYEK